MIGAIWSTDDRSRGDLGAETNSFDARTSGDTSARRSFSRDDVFHVLRNRRRRYAIHYLRQVEETDIGRIAEKVAAWENGIPVEEVDSTARKRVYNSLQQTHLPKLDDLGVVDYDFRTGRVELTDAVDRFDVHLEVLPRREIPWAEFYLAFSAVGVALVVAVWFGIYPFTLLSGVTWMAVFVVTFAVAATANYVTLRRSVLGKDGPPPEVRSGG